MLQIHPDAYAGQGNTLCAHTEAAALLWPCNNSAVVLWPARAYIWASTTLQWFRESLHHGSHITVSVEVQEYILYKSLLFLLRPLGWICHASHGLGQIQSPLCSSWRQHWVFLTANSSAGSGCNQNGPLSPFNRISPTVSCSINVTFYIVSQNLNFHRTNKVSMEPYLVVVWCTLHSVLQNSLAGLWPFAFVRPLESRENGNKLTDYLVMNNTPDVVNPIFCGTSTEAVDGCNYNISLLLKAKIKAGSCSERGKKRVIWVTLLKEAHEIFPLQINLTEILKIRGVPQGVMLASQKHLLWTSTPLTTTQAKKHLQASRFVFLRGL